MVTTGIGTSIQFTPSSYYQDRGLLGHRNAAWRPSARAVSPAWAYILWEVVNQVEELVTCRRENVTEGKASG
jgi:hypothetical protein